jgi:hypothetical protein
MLTTLLIPLALGTGHAAGAVHTPHAECSGVAIGVRSDGAREVVLASRNETNILHSYDQGLTWQVVTGAGIEQTFPTRISWFPNGAQSAFLIATDQGVFRYDAEAGSIHRYTTGISMDDADLVDLETAREGQEMPAIACNDMGAVFVLDPSTQVWSKVLDTGEEDRNAVVAIVPNYDRTAAPGPGQSMAAGINGRLYLSEDGGQNWSIHPDFATPAADETEWHITAIAFGDQYAVDGELLVGRGRENAASFTGDEGELWRSSDHGGSFSQVSVLGESLLYSSVQEIVSAPMGPSGDAPWFLSFHFLSDFIHFADSRAVLQSMDGGLTWEDPGSRQDFVQELASNEKTAVGREYRGMFTIQPDPFYAFNGEVWMARSEGVYFSGDEGSSWQRRQLRPSKQVRGVGVGIDVTGDLFAYAATYGSANVRVNVTDRVAEWVPGSGMAFQLPAVVSPNSFEDGVMLSGGQDDVVAKLEAPAPVRQRGFWSVNALFEAALGETGYVRTLELSPLFSAVPRAGSNQALIWSARLKDSTRGETRLSLDGLRTVQLANEIEGFPNETAPWMKSLSFSPTFDPVGLPTVLDVFGGSYRDEQTWHMKNLGTQAAPQFAWAPINWTPPARVQAVYADPRFQRPDDAVVWVLTTEGLYRVRDLSADWSDVEVTNFPKFENLPLALELPPDMAARPMIYVMTWGGGLLKLDPEAASPVWESVGVDFPAEWGNCFDFSPDFANTREIVAGGQNGLLYGRDVPGFAWERLPMDFATDNANPGIAFFDPNNPDNPDPARRWGWDRYSNFQLPDGAPFTFFGGTATWTDSDGAYLEYPRLGGSFAVRAVAGPIMGSITAQVLDFRTGALLETVQVDLNQPNYEMLEIPVPVGGGPRQMLVRVTAHLDAGEAFYFDGFRFQE